MSKNKCIFSWDFNTNTHKLEVHFKNNDWTHRNETQFNTALEKVTEIHCHFYEVIDARTIANFKALLADIPHVLKFKCIFHVLETNETTIISLLSQMPEMYMLNIYNFKHHILSIDFIENEGTQALVATHNQQLIEQLKLAIQQQIGRNTVNEHQLKNALTQLEHDYQDLYSEYIKQHKRMQYAFRELHRFKRSAWKYKKIYLNHERLIDLLEKANTYQKKVNKKNVKKGMKWFWREVVK